MKKSLLVILCAFLSTTFTVSAQKFTELQKSPTDISYAKKDRNAAPEIKIIYSRPQKKGRKIFGNLVGYDKVWRTGADEATEVKFYQDTKIGERLIKAGTYSLFTIPGEKEWTVIINSDLDLWGAYTYNKDNDIARVSIPATNENEPLEVFSIAFKKTDKGYHMIMGWDTTRVAVPFTI